MTGFLLVRYFPNARGSGIPQTKFALFINNCYISLKTVIGKFVCCATSLASGIALGGEGPRCKSERELPPRWAADSDWG